MGHITVLTKEAVEALNLKPGSVVVDCTLGSGGHAKEILATLGKDGHYIGLDADPTAIEANQDLTKATKAKVTLVNDNFRNIKKVISSLDLLGVDAILADLGWRQEQFSGETALPRGFSFQSDEPLKMTYGNPTDYAFTAYEIINDWDQDDIANVIYGYGEERYSRRIARSVVEHRKKQPIETAKELSEIVSEAMPHRERHKKIHPATKTFQALRIAVNDEFDALSELIADGFEVLNPGGRMAIISFHSLEDRIVKQTFRELKDEGSGVLVSKKPIIASEEEIHDNPRSRSAKLRTIEKI